MTALATHMPATDGHSKERPFQPLFTIRRSGRIEVTVYGIVSVVVGLDVHTKSPDPGGADRPYQSLLATGDTNFELWSRSLLKPWQLLTNLQILIDNYPDLTDEHFALFMASHSGEAVHIKALEEIIAITGVEENYLKCPPANPVDGQTKELMKVRGEKARRRYHNCSGKHSGYLASVKATLGPDKMKDYLVESEPHHIRLKAILSMLTGRPAESFTATTDGCQLPNYALSAAEMSYLYMTLLNQGTLTRAAREDSIFAPYGEIGQLMLNQPQMVSGQGRLDFKIMSRELFSDAPAMVAKEGADGLLGIGIAASQRYPHGLGIAIKLSSGFDSHHMELITREILTALDLIGNVSKVTSKSEPNSNTATIRTDHIQTEFHFLSDLKKTD